MQQNKFEIFAQFALLYDPPMSVNLARELPESVSSDSNEILTEEKSISENPIPYQFN